MDKCCNSCKLGILTCPIKGVEYREWDIKKDFCSRWAQKEEAVRSIFILPGIKESQAKWILQNYVSKEKLVNYINKGYKTYDNLIKGDLLNFIDQQTEAQ